MAKGNTTPTPRRATAAKATKAATRTDCRSVQWGTDDKGRPIIMWAPSWAAHDLPAGRWRLVHATIVDLQDAANGITTLRTYPVADVAEAMSVLAARTVSLIDALIEHVHSFLALSPKLREAVAKIEARLPARRTRGEG
jgi:hypothetical protein